MTPTFLANDLWVGYSGTVKGHCASKTARLEAPGSWAAHLHSQGKEKNMGTQAQPTEADRKKFREAGIRLHAPVIFSKCEQAHYERPVSSAAGVVSIAAIKAIKTSTGGDTMESNVYGQPPRKILKRL
jgi:hypothetical protein